MASQGIRELIRRLAADNEVLRRFLESPAEVLSSQPLAEEERQALLRLRARLATPDGSVEARVGPLGSWP